MTQESAKLAIYCMPTVLRESRFSPDVLELVHGTLTSAQDRTPYVDRLQAEVSYLLASSLKQSGFTTRAEQLARESADLYRRLNIETLQDAAGNILSEKLPELMGEGVVESRFGLKKPSS